MQAKPGGGPASCLSSGIEINDAESDVVVSAEWLGCLPDADAFNEVEIDEFLLSAGARPVPIVVSVSPDTEDTISVGAKLATEEAIAANAMIRVKTSTFNLYRNCYGDITVYLAS